MSVTNLLSTKRDGISGAFLPAATFYLTYFLTYLT